MRKDTKFKPGKSGNPNGRPKGSDYAKQFRELIGSESEELVKVAVDEAKSGNTTALKLCIDRLYPQTKARDEPVDINELDIQTSLVEQGNQVLTSLVKKEISPSEACSVMSALTQKAKLIETEDLIKRVEKLEDARSR